MRPSLTVDVALTPALVPPAQRSDGTVYVVIDVIRATTTLCALFERGLSRVFVAPGIAEARAARSFLGADYLLAGEVGGARPEGFDLGNAPSELAAHDLQGRYLIFATTNGTRALHACRTGFAVFTGTFRNAAAVTRAALAASDLARPAPINAPATLTPAPSANVASEATAVNATAAITFVCSGRGERPAYDDTLCAGYLVSALLEAAHADDRTLTLGEGAQIALGLWRDVAHQGDLLAALASSAAGRSIESIGLSADLAWCAAIDATTIVPTLTPDLLIIESHDADSATLLFIEPYDYSRKQRPFAPGV